MILFSPFSSWAVYVPFFHGIDTIPLVLVRGCAGKDKVEKLVYIQFIHFNFALKKVRAFTVSVSGFQAYFEQNEVGQDLFKE